MVEIIGIIGGLLIIFAWIWETAEAVRGHKKLVDLKFSGIFLIAAILLTIYSWERQDMVFLWINIILMIILSIEIWFSIHIKKVHKRK